MHWPQLRSRAGTQTLTPALPKPPKAVLSAAVPNMPLPPAPGAFCPSAWPLALQDQDGAQGCELAPCGAVRGVQGEHTGLNPAPGVPTARAGTGAVGEQGSIPMALRGDPLVVGLLRHASRAPQTQLHQDSSDAGARVPVPSRAAHPGLSLQRCVPALGSCPLARCPHEPLVQQSKAMCCSPVTLPPQQDRQQEMESSLAPCCHEDGAAAGGPCAPQASVGAGACPALRAMRGHTRSPRCPTPVVFASQPESVPGALDAADTGWWCRWCGVCSPPGRGGCHFHRQRNVQCNPCRPPQPTPAAPRGAMWVRWWMLCSAGRRGAWWWSGGCRGPFVWAGWGTGTGAFPDLSPFGDVQRRRTLFRENECRGSFRGQWCRSGTKSLNPMRANRTRVREEADRQIPDPTGRSAEGCGCPGSRGSWTHFPTQRGAREGLCCCDTRGQSPHRVSLRGTATSPP